MNIKPVELKTKKLISITVTKGDPHWRCRWRSRPIAHWQLEMASTQVWAASQMAFLIPKVLRYFRDVAGATLAACKYTETKVYYDRAT